MKRVFRATNYRETFYAHNAVKAVENAVRSVSTASSCKYRKVSYEKFEMFRLRKVQFLNIVSK